MLTPNKIAVMLVVAVACVAVKAGPLPGTGVLTNAAQIRNLKATEAAQAIPVQLRGVVIDEPAPHEDALMVADETAGIYLLAITNLFHGYHRGDLVEVGGVTDPGEFAPIVRAASARKIGMAPIPAPRPVTYQELITGSMDGQWVEISGVVHRCLVPAPEVWRIYVAANGGMVSVRGPGPKDALVQEDAEVRVQAVCFYQFNKKRQVLTPVLQLPAGVKVEVLKPAPANAFDSPLRAADSLLQFAPDSSNGHRVHVHGVVTHSQPGSLVWIRDRNSGLRIQTLQAEKVQPGDQIEVLGFLAYGATPPLLEDAIFQKTGITRPPVPIAANATNAFGFEDDLIEVEAMITDVQPTLEGAAVTLDADGTVFKALLKNSAGYRRTLDWQPQSRVRVVGICTVIHEDVRPQLMGVWQPQSFQIWMRSPSDLTVLTRPPWWTPQHTILFLGGIISGLLLISGAGMMRARHRLKEQGRHRAMAEAEFAAILAERNRLAREIHDTLAQGLVATSVQLRLARKQSNGASTSLQHHLDSAQQMVHNSLQEARNSIWNMRSQVLEEGDLVNALKGILHQMTDDTEVKTEFEVAGNTRRLAPVIEDNLLRVGQEAITNATKHARAEHVRVRLEFTDAQFTLTVSDDGLGFDPAKPRSSSGGFGLLGMRERVAEMQGELQIRSAPGKGTEISLTIPLASEAPALETSAL